MKRIMYLSIISISLMLLAISCRSTMQFGEKINSVDTSNFDTNHFLVLGTISIEGVTDKGASYIEIFNAAKEAYSDVDEVVNIHIDYKTLPTNGTKIIMTGIAVKYNR